jgi:hypothetical protein
MAAVRNTALPVTKIDATEQSADQALVYAVYVELTSKRTRTGVSPAASAAAV